MQKLSSDAIEKFPVIGEFLRWAHCQRKNKRAPWRNSYRLGNGKIYLEKTLIKEFDPKSQFTITRRALFTK